MKKNGMNSRFRSGSAGNLLKKMKLLIAFFFTGLLGVSATTYSQQTKLSLKFDEVTVKEAFKLIEKNSEFVFFYNEDYIDVYRKVSLNANDEKVESILNELLNGTQNTFKIYDRQIVILANEMKESPSVSVIRSETNAEQKKVISGAVKDNKGLSLPGVSVVVKGTTTGIITDADGKFTLSVPADAKTLSFSFVGMKTQEIILGNRTSINVVMAEEIAEIEEVVAVGYGTQKKVNLTGSVASVSSNTLATRATTNASNLLQGRMSGLEIIQPSGQPGRDDAIIKIRGLGSFGASSAPLVLVDGVMGSLSNLAPNDIESVTVLKDAASASIYGSRAANGVILVITKRAKRGSNVEYQIDMGVQSATRLPKLVTNSADYMEFYNAARVRAYQPPLYTQAEIDSYRNATDKNQYPNFDWLDYYYNPAAIVNHFLSFSNVTDKSTYRASFNYLNQDGILPNINYKKYNTQLSFANQLTKAIKMGTNVSVVFKDNHAPPIGNANVGDDPNGVAAYQAGPNYSPFLPDGSGRKVCWAYPKEGHNVNSPVAFSNGETLVKDYILNGQVFFDIDLYKGLKWNTIAAVNYAGGKRKNHNYLTKEHYYFQKLPGETDYTLNPTVMGPGGGVIDTYNISTLATVSSVLNYETKIKKNHNLTALLGFEQQSYYSQYIRGNRKTFPTASLSELVSGSTNGQNVTGSAFENALRSYFGRVGYDINGKYLAEVNARYDGTSRVSTENRWGFFPSVSAGWRMSEENFIKNNVNWLDNLKLRGSYGVLGNQEIGNYPYQDILNFSSYALNSTMVQGVQYTRLTDKKLRWESTKVLDFGLDVDMKNGLFGMTFDWFKKNTYNILATLPVPRSIGLAGPTTNDGEMQNIGFEMELRHRNQIGQFTYDTYFIMSAYKNKLLSIAVPTKGEKEVGLAYNSFYIYEFNGVFDDQADIDNSPTQVFKTPQPGDVKVKDQDGDGIVDANDRISISPFPDFTYSFGFNVGWKGFNLSTFFQGVQGLRQLIYGWGFDPFVQMDPPNVKYYDSWSPTNTTSDIPAVWLGSGGDAGNNGYRTTYHLPDASYLRLKNVNLSYTLPRQIVNKIRLQELTVFVSGDNLITFTKYPGVDPEVPNQVTSGAAFPQVRILNAGLKIKF